MTETARSDPPQPVFRLVYRSHSRIGAEDREAALVDIFSVARSRNKRAGVTGALLMTDHYFVQLLEGDEAEVRALYERIARDERHDDVTVIETGSVGSRTFARWAMAQVSPTGQADIPLLATEGHLLPAAREPVTREQAGILRTMRNTIGADVL